MKSIEEPLICTDEVLLLVVIHQCRCNVSYASMCHMMSANQQQLCLQCVDVVDYRWV